MKIIYNNIIPFKGFTAINLFGILFIRKNNKVSKRLLNHEAIHTAQMKELWYVPFYILYLLEWLIKIIKTRSSIVAYRTLSFEKEAYTYEAMNSYLAKRKKFAWYDFM